MTSWRFVVVTGTIETRCAGFAEAQEGRMARWQLLAAGVTDWQIKRRIDSGVLLPEHRGVYAYGHAAPTAHSAEIAALLTRGPGTLIGSHSAAAMWRFRAKPGGVVHIVVPATQGGGHRPGIRVHRSAESQRLEPRYIGGVPVVAPAYALLDIAGDITGRDLERALDEALSLGIVNRDEVAAVLARHPTAPGAGTLRELLRMRLVGNPSRSDGQEKLLALIREAGLPDPEMDVQIGERYSVDCLWRAQGVAAEFDSFQWHTSRSAWARDRRKDALCREKGIDLIRLTYEDLTTGRLRTTARLTRRIYAQETRAA